MQLPRALADRVLDTWPVATLATIGADGRPQLVPMVFARSGDRLWSAVDGKPKASAELARLRNVRRDPRVTLLLDAYQADWSMLWWLRVEGRASVVVGAGSDPAIAEAAEALRHKYPQYETVPLFQDPATLLSIEIGSTRSWCASAEVVIP